MVYLSENFDDLMAKLPMMTDGDDIYAMWSIIDVYDDNLRRMTSRCLSISKESGTYSFVIGMLTPQIEDMCIKAIKMTNVVKWYEKIFGINLIGYNYDDLVKILHSLNTIVHDECYSGESKSIKYISFDRHECDKQCQQFNIYQYIKNLNEEIKKYIKNLNEGIKAHECTEKSLEELKIEFELKELIEKLKNI